MATNSDSSGNSGGVVGGGCTTTEARPSRYESQKRRDWNTFGQYLRNHRPPLALSRCSGAHVLEFLRYLDQFGKTKVHSAGCSFFGVPQPPAPCPCPLKQAWGSLDALVGRLRAAFEENGGHPDANPFGARAVRLYLRDVRDTQAKARGIAYEKKKRKRPNQQNQQHHQQTPLTLPPSPPPLPPLTASQLDVNTLLLPPIMHHHHQSFGNELELGHVQIHHHHHHRHGLVMSMVGSEHGGEEEAVIGVSDGRSGTLIPLSVLH